MEDYKATDIAAAARHLENARTSILEAVRAVCNHSKAQDLKEVADQLKMKADLFGKGLFLPALNVPVVGRKGAARAMGKIPSDEKLKKLAEARVELAKVRSADRAARELQMKVAKHTMKNRRTAKLAAAAVKRASATTSISPTPVIPEPIVESVNPPSVQ